MPNLDYSTFFGNLGFEDQVLQNVISFLQEGFLQIGMYYNHTRGVRNNNGDYVARLAASNKPGFLPNTIYRGIRNDCIWETGITLAYTGGVAPINISGVYVNNTFYPTGTSVAGNSYYINYPEGEVVFAGAVTGTVEVNHSARGLSIYPADSARIKNYISYYDGGIPRSTPGSGIDNYTNKALPASLFVSVGSQTSQPMGLGSRDKYVTSRLSFDVFSDNPSDLRKIKDFLYFLEEKSFLSFDAQSAQQALGLNGARLAGAKTFSQLQADYPATQFWFEKNASVSKQTTPLWPMQYYRVTIGLTAPVSI